MFNRTVAGLEQFQTSRPCVCIDRRHATSARTATLRASDDYESTRKAINRLRILRFRQARAVASVEARTCCREHSVIVNVSV
jgi:hypothetical protein